MSNEPSMSNESYSSEPSVSHELKLGCNGVWEHGTEPLIFAVRIFLMVLNEQN